MSSAFVSSVAWWSRCNLTPRRSGVVWIPVARVSPYLPPSGFNLPRLNCPLRNAQQAPYEPCDIPFHLTRPPLAPFILHHFRRWPLVRKSHLSCTLLLGTSTFSN